MIEEHEQRTDSPVARDVLARWEQLLAAGAFVKVMPHDYKRVLRELAEARGGQRPPQRRVAGGRRRLRAGSTRSVPARAGEPERVAV